MQLKRLYIWIQPNISLNTKAAPLQNPNLEQ
jgi:hypothetical protein